jgi:hypothetical protein
MSRELSLGKRCESHDFIADLEDKSRSVPISFCLKQECLDHGLTRYVDQVCTSYNYILLFVQIHTCKPFQNVIWAYEVDLEKVDHLLPKVKWEVIPPEV